MPREARWERVLTQLQRLAAAAQRIDIAGRIEALAVERERPLYVAVIGEFNAGKSTFLNALLGVDVAPTGVRPTTACLHWVAWAPDPFARVVVRGARDRVVMHSELKRALAELEASGASVDRVYIYAPIERLKRIEVLDTPGFNAPDASHGEQARRGVDEAHVALWLFDAGSPLKHSEREVLDPIARAGVPIQVLLNKKDRLKPGDLERVMEYLTSALGEIGLSSALLGEPVAMSARLALQGRLGDADALAASGWAEVERLLTEELVGNRDELRERALRRKARRIAVELVAALEEAAQRHQREAELMRDRQRRLRDQAAALAGKAGGRQRETLREQLAQALDRARVLLDDDMQPIAALPPERHADPAIASYRIDRTVARFAPAACQAIAETCHDDTVAATIEDPLRAVIAGAASVRSELSWSPALLGALAEALLRVAERALSSAAHDDSAGAHDDPALRRARALAAALA
jgi:ribosome biogenesis GTPase A